jgi:hypothetical protein
MFCRTETLCTPHYLYDVCTMHDQTAKQLCGIASDGCLHIDSITCLASIDGDVAMEAWSWPATSRPWSCSISSYKLQFRLLPLQWWSYPSFRTHTKLHHWLIMQPLTGQSINPENIRIVPCIYSRRGSFKMLRRMMRRWWRRGASHELGEPVRVGPTEVLQDCNRRRSLFMVFRSILWSLELLASSLALFCMASYQWQLALMSLSVSPSLEVLSTHENCSYYRKITRVAWSWWRAVDLSTIVLPCCLIDLSTSC